MTDEQIAELITQSNAALVATVTGALQQFMAPPAPTVKLSKFMGYPQNEPTILDWLDEFETFARQVGICNADRAVAVLDHLGGRAREEVLCHPDVVQHDYCALVALLKLRFGPHDSVYSLSTELYARVQLDG